MNGHTLSGTGDTTSTKGVIWLSRGSSYTSADFNFTVKNGTITNGYATSYAGGIGVSDSKKHIALTLDSVTFTNNTGSSAGAVSVTKSIEATNCTFTGNTSTSSSGAGAIKSAAGSTLTLTNCVITGNSGGQGGGIYVQRAASSNTTLDLSTGNNVIYGNTASTAGDDIFLQASSGSNTLTVTLPDVTAWGVNASGLYQDGTYDDSTIAEGSRYSEENAIEVSGSVELCYIATSDLLRSIGLKVVIEPLASYTVTYTDGVDNEVIFEDQSYTVEEGTATPDFEGTPTRTGYTFNGWEPTVADTVTEDVTYTATWTANEYTVTLDANGGEVTPSSLTVTYDSAVGELPTPISSDPTVYFAGWYDAEGNLVTSDTLYTTAGDSTLTAKWSLCVARVESTGVYYVTLQDALDAVKESLASLGGTQTETVTLVADTVECVTFSWGSSALTSLDLTIDLNGHTVDGNSEGTVMAFTRATSYSATAFSLTISIADSVGTGVITGGSGSSGGAISLSSFKSNDSLDIKGGTITGNTANYGGAIYCSVASVAVNVSGGTITGNSAKNGGAIYARLVNVTGGVITGNTAFVDADNETTTGRGGGIYSYPATGVAKVTISGGQVYGNTADTTGDDIYFLTRTKNSTTSGLTLIDASEMGVDGIYGWYKDEIDNRYSADNSVEFTDLTFNTAGTIVALKAASGYATVTYVDDEGNVLQSTKLANGSATPAYEGETPTKENYIFSGWADAEGNAVAETVMGDATYVPVWTGVTVTVTLNGNGATLEDSTIEVTYGSAYPDLPTPTLNGFSGEGWYIVNEDGTYTEITSETVVTNPNDHELIYLWSVADFTVTLTSGYNKNTWSMSWSSSLASFDLTAEVTAIDGLSYSYQWYKDDEAIEGATGSTLTINGNVLESGVYKVVVTATLADGSDIVLVNDSATAEAQNTLTIRRMANTLYYKANGGTGGPSSNYANKDEMTIQSTIPTREGYTFVGWNTEADGSGDSYASGGTYDFSDYYTDENTLANGGLKAYLYAQWTANTYTVTLDAGDGSVDPTSIAVTYDSAIGELPTPTSSDPTVYFAGWYDAEGNLVTSESIYATAGDSTLTAKWSLCVARVESTGVYYVTLQDALDAVKESLASLGGTQTETVTLVADTVECVTFSWGSNALTSLDLTIDLNGHTVTGDGSGTVMAFSRVTTYTFTLSISIADSVGSGVITGGNASSGGAISLSSFKSGDSLNIKGGTITGNTASSTGGAIYCSVAGVAVNVSGGTITGNTANNGGAISARKVVVTGGVITGNTATKYGGGIYAYASSGVAYVSISGGQVYGNTADSAGDDIYYYTKTYNSSTAGLTLIAASEMGVEGVYGWYNDKSGSRYSEDNCSEFTDLTFTDKATTVALKAASGYATVTYVDDEGKVLQSTKLANGSATPAYEGETPTKENYIFSGWADAEGNAVAETVMGDVTYVPVWTGVTVTVTLNGNGATLEDSTIEVTYGSAYPELPTPTLNGFSGEGWYIVNEDGTYTEITSETVVTNPNNHELIYLWSVAGFTVTLTSGYNKNTWSMSWSSSLASFDLTAEVTAIDGLSYSYQWYKDDEAIEGATGSTLTINGNVLESGVYKVVVTATLADSGDIVLLNDSATAEAQNTLTIRRMANTLYYNANGGTGGPSNNFANEDTLTIQSTKPTREGYTFVGWNTEADGSGDSYASGGTFDFSDYYTDENTLANGGLKAYLYAQWTANSYTVTLDAGDGTVDPTSIAVTYDSAIGELPVATLDGYTFEGWYDENGEEVTAETVYTTAGDSTLTAQYSTLEVPTLVSATNSLTGITVTWEAVDGAVQYQVLRRISTSTPWTAWEVVAVTSDTSYLDTDVVTGEIYRYTVACVAEDGTTRTSLYNTTGVAVRWVAPTTAKAANQASGIQVTWTKVEGADGYMIYRKTASGSYKWIATIRDVDTLSYLDKNVSSGTDYTYSVRAFVSATQSAYTVVGLWRLSEPELTLTTSSGSVTLSWNKVTGAEGYYIYRRNASGAFERIATISSGSTVKFTDSTAVSGTHYYYAVRAYKSYTGSSYTAVDIICK